MIGFDHVRIFLDQDGPLADCQAGLVAALPKDFNFDGMNQPSANMTAEQRKRESKIKAAMNVPGFFLKLPLAEGALHLWKYCMPMSPRILTAIPKAADAVERSKSEKRQWAHKHFGALPDDRFLACLASEKQDFIDKTVPVNILVDDRESNCDAWTAAGGTAILHKTAKESIRGIIAALQAVRE